VTFDPTPILVAAGGAVVVLLILGRVPDAGDRVLDQASRERIHRRLAELSRDPTATQADDPALDRSPALRGIDPRLRLWRDTSSVLVLLGIALVGAVLVNGRTPSGAVLETVATPAPVAPLLAASAIPPSPSPPAHASASLPDPVAQSHDPALTPVASAAPAATRQRPSAERLALLQQCPDEPDCYLYEVRPGDNLSSIASWFGVPYADVLARNPGITNPATVRSGEVIRLPTPRR